MSGERRPSSQQRLKERLTLYPAAIVVAIFLGVVLATIAAVNVEDRSDSFGGDYPAFYGAGRIAADGDWEDLYHLDRQIEAQADLHPEDEGGSAWFFAYPPQVAYVYQPLVGINYYWSYLFHTLLMGILLWSAILLARPLLPWLRSRVVLALATALLFWPMFRTISGGSNTALTIFLLVAAWRLVHDEKELAAGVVLAVLLYKPQFALPMIGLFLLRRHWRVVVGAGIGGFIFYVTGAILRGGNWIAEWLDVAAEFGRVDAELNGHSSISILGFAENLFGVGLSGPVVVGWVLVGAVVVFLSWLWWRSPRTGLARLMAITMPGLLLLSPHAMSHDGAIVLLTAAVGVAIVPPQSWLPWVGVIWILGASQLFIRQLGFSPGFPMLLIVLLWGWLLLGAEDAGEICDGVAVSKAGARD